MKKLGFVLLSLSPLLFAISGCGDDNVTNPTPDQPQIILPGPEDRQGDELPKPGHPRDDVLQF